MTSRFLDVRIHLLDRQLVDPDGDPVGTVDDLDVDGIVIGEAIEPGAPPPRITGILTGQVFENRILGGRPPRAQLQAIPWDLVDRLGIVVTLRRTGVANDAQWREHWLRDHVISRIPGGRRAGQ